MVKVITIRDDVYINLYRLKISKGMSFSEIIEYVLKENEGKTKDVLSFAGSIDKEDIDRRSKERIRYDFGEGVE